MPHRNLIQAVFHFLGIAWIAGNPHGVPATSAEAWTGYTEATEFVLDSPQLLNGMTWSTYQTTVEPFSNIKAFIPLREPVLDEKAKIQYGLNAVLPVATSSNIRNLSWALIDRSEGPPTLIVDVNGSGVLSDDPRIEFSEAADGRLMTRQELRLPRELGALGGHKGRLISMSV